MKRYLLLILFCATSSCASGAAPAVKPHPSKAVAIYTPPPDYPLEARAAHLTGSAIVLLQVDHNTGYVTAAQIVKSTGHPILDTAALRAFKLWRFQPGSARQIRMPIHYEMNGKT